jgi:hypothetical protein
MSKMIIQPKLRWREGPCPIPMNRAYYAGDLKLFGGLEPAGWHLSISHPRRNPTWEEIKQARYEFCPHDVTLAMILPPTDEYVNIHNFCFHLHQIPNE